MRFSNNSVLRFYFKNMATVHLSKNRVTDSGGSRKFWWGEDNKNSKHKTLKIRMSSLKLRLILRPKSEIRTFFPPKFGWSPKKKRSSPRLRLIFRKFKRFFRPKSGGLQKKKRSSPRLRLIFRKFKRFFRPNSGGLQKKKKVFTEVETNFSAEIVSFRLVGGGMHPPHPPPKSATGDGARILLRKTGD